MIVFIILLALGAVSLLTVCLCKSSKDADRHMEGLESRKEFDEQ